MLMARDPRTSRAWRSFHPAAASLSRSHPKSGSLDEIKSGEIESVIGARASIIG